ncbi:hypothetical protein HHK36_030127 [Tetracentron sinense]|uniref:Uncharacterized protein n=1 Tax=Tetracentron sinense TaxID=13715 RepID=A0A835D384_TETSI|nr:hypothetical protein HHK36_030127 [Tetracentron sinense]
MEAPSSNHGRYKSLGAVLGDLYVLSFAYALMHISIFAKPHSRPLSPVVQVSRTVAVLVQEEQQGATIAADIVTPTQTVVAPPVAAPVPLRRSSQDKRSAISSDYEVYLNEVRPRRNLIPILRLVLPILKLVPVMLKVCRLRDRRPDGYKCQITGAKFGVPSNLEPI